MNEIDKINELNRIRKLNESYAATPDFGTGELLMRPEDTSIQGASEDFMGFLKDPLAEVIPPASIPMRDGQPFIPEEIVPASVAPVEAVKPSVQESTKPQVPGFTPPVTPTTPTLPQEDILSQLKAARAANEAAMLTARQADSSTDLGNTLMRSGSKLAEAIANRSGNTKIKLEADQAAAKEVDFAGAANKGRLNALMQDYGIKKGLEDTAYNRQKDTDARTDRLAESKFDRDYKNRMLKATEAKSKQDTLLNKEEVKEGIQISKENRKVRRDLDESIPALESQLQNIKEAKAMLIDKENGQKGVATGPVDQYYSKMTKEGQTLTKKLNKISLDTMVKMFSGMSKAVDTNAERAQFQSTQPSMGDYQDVNIDTLTKLENSIDSVIKKTNAARQLYDRTGDFTQPEEKQSNVAPQQDKPTNQSTGPYGDTVDRNGKTYKWNSSAGKYQPI